MSVAWYIVLERPISGFDHGVNGKSLARAGELADKFAASASVKPLMDFFSASQADMEAFIDEANVSDSKTIAEQWYSADEGLQTVKALITAVEATTIDRKADVLADLKEFEAVLERAKRDGIRWHLAVDY